MKAIVISRFGGPEVLELRDVATPAAGRGEVRVRVRATAINRADLLQRVGAYPAPPDAPQDIPGLEFAGEVDAVGEGVTDLSPGDRVFGLCGGGAYAEALVVHGRTVAPIPDGLSFTDAAAVPEAFITAWDAMVLQARLCAGESVLVHAVGSGVGTAAAQIARAIGARVIGTARTRDKLDRVRALGLDQAGFKAGLEESFDGVLVENGTFAVEVNRATGGQGADVILELVGGRYLTEDLACVARRGRIMLVGLMAGAHADLDLTQLLHRRVQLTGTMLRARPLEEKIAAVQQLSRHLVPLFARELLRPVVDRVLPLAQAAEAHSYVASNAGFGKVVLSV